MRRLGNLGGSWPLANVTPLCNKLIARAGCRVCLPGVAVQVMRMIVDSEPGVSSAGTYRIVVRGQIHGLRAPQLCRMIISERPGGRERPESILVGTLPNQAALLEVFAVLHEMGVPLLSVELLHTG